MSDILSSIPSLADSPTQFFFAVGLVLVVVRLTILYFTTLRYPSNLPRVCEKPNASSFRLSTRWKYYVDAASLQREAFDKFTKKGKTVLMPGLGFRDEVLLPHTSLKWLNAQPESVASLYQAFREMDQITASFPDEKVIMNPWNAMLVRREVLPTLESIYIGLDDELNVAFRARFGEDEENWNEVKVIDAAHMLIAQAASRFTVGVPLCRNESYLKVSTAWVSGFVFNAGFAGIFPIILRPAVKLLLSIPQRLRLARLQKHIAPLYHERVALLSSPNSSPDPGDQFQMMLRYASVHEPSEMNPWDMTCRIAGSNLGSFHQTYLAAANIIFNVVASDPQYDTIAQLRDEFTRVLRANGGKWTKATVAQLWKADSVCRETLRLQAFSGRALIRKVVAPDGLLTEDGVRVPCGSMISIPNWAAQTDADMYENPLDFDPWRYSRVREAAAATAASVDGADEKTPSIPPQTFVTTGASFLPFGHGKHACPGRFIVDGELKMLMAQLVCNYDLKFPDEYNGVRPPNEWMSEAYLPPQKGKILVKRRKWEF